jgi:eukaryotic-like serine/threonine-protein kinase
MIRYDVGPYEVLDTLGSGGMGTVYLARDVRLDRRVALKFIRSDRSPSTDDDTQQRLLHEARAASVLNHPNVCHVYDVGGEGRDSWIAMEYVEGAPLASVIRSAGRLPPRDVIRLGRQIAEALAHAHDRGILHRDLKTANIVCDREGRPKILDFGIAACVVQDIAAEVTHSATSAKAPAVEGTLSYMAPEVIRGNAQDERSDLWSLGVILFEMLSGSLPFHGRNTFDLAAAIVQGDTAALPDHVPAPLTRIVARLLSRDPANRYSSATEAAAALDALTDVGKSAPARARVAVPWPQLLLTIGLVTIGVYAMWRLQRHTPLRLTEQRLISTGAFAPRAELLS